MCGGVLGSEMCIVASVVLTTRLYYVYGGWGEGDEWLWVRGGVDGVCFGV